METEVTTLPNWRVRLMRAHEHDTPPAGKTKPISNHAAAAKMVKTTLKTVFPGIDFEVKSKSYSGGSSISVHWTDGPTSRMVDRIIGRHEYGHFDGMIDLYEYDNDRDDIPQVKYAHGTRHMSPEAIQAIIAHLNQYWGYALEFDPATNWIRHGSDKFESGRGYQSDEIWRTFSPLSLICDDCTAKTLPLDKFCPQCGASLKADES